MAKYNVIDAKAHDARHHRPGTVSARGECALHACGERAVITMVGETQSGRRVTLAVCERGAHEYGLSR